MNIRDLIPESLRAEALAVVKQLARAEVPAPYRAQRLAKDGRIVEIWLTATALVKDAGEIYAIATTEREAVKRSFGDRFEICPQDQESREHGTN